MALLFFFQRAVLICVLTLGAAVAAEASRPLGVWTNPKQTVAVRIFQCQDYLCGRIIWLKKPLDKAGKPKRDHHNPDESQRNRPLCGLKILRHFKPAGDNRWDSGIIYNPSDGSVYRSVMRLKSDGTLEVRGYVGLPLFGKSITWKRADISRTACGMEGDFGGGEESTS